MSDSPLRIAIDGPSGAGKSTLARALARALGLRYLDTGAMYRAVAWKAMQAQAVDADEVVALLEKLDMQVIADPENFRVRIEGFDVTDELRTPAVGRRASEVAQIPAVRAWLLQRQRAEAEGGAVLEGRDIGSAVLPDADAKLFITAPEAERLQRRALQLVGASAAEVAEDVRARDRRDQRRPTSPLRIPPDATVIDTGGEDEKTSLERVLSVVRAAR
ncbi:MAG TPA: (d)CMP kinase [Acidobacteriota bacterium]|nr:(d)CMP kinase [Acidobacteriota bacterium]